MSFRASAAVLSAIAITSVTAVGLAGSPAAAASLGTATPTPATIANTVTAQKVSVATSTNALLYLAGASAQIVGPGSLKDTYAGSSVTHTSSGNATITATFDLVTAAGLPAAPGTYEIDTCTALSCAVPVDTGSITVTGAAPTPGTVSTPFSIAAGATGNVTIPGKGFAKDETLSITRPGGSASDATFTENTTTSTATSLVGTLKVGASVPDGIYDLVVTDPSGQSGVCKGCLEVGTASATGPGPVTGLVATAITASTASVSWGAPTSGTTPTGYSVVVSKTSTTKTDSGVTVTHSGTATTASVSGLTPSTLYYVTVTATDGTNTSTPYTVQLQSPNATALSLKAARTLVTDGNGVVLSGYLAHQVKTGSGTSTVADAGQTIVITQKSYTGKVSAVGHAQTNNAGDYTFKVFPNSDTTYGAYFAGATGGTSGIPDSQAYSNSDPVVRVAPLVVVPAKIIVSKHGKLVIHGTVSPNEAGRKVYLWRIDGTGKSHHAGKAKLTAGSHLTIHGKLPKTNGVYTYRVTIAAHPGHEAGKSAAIKVRRK